MPHPLTGRRILVTRASGQASALAAALEQTGATPILIPAIAIAPPGSYAQLDAALTLSEFDWLVFTSANAVDAFFSRARILGVVPRFGKVAAIGPATATAIIDAQSAVEYSTILQPPKAIAESLGASLLPHVYRQMAEKGIARVLLVRAEQARDVLPELLRSAGADLTIAPAYRNVVPLDSVTLLRALFAERESWPDAIPFTSSSSVTNLVTLLEAAGLVLPPEILRVSIGPITSQTLRDRGLPEHVEAAEATIPALVQALISVLRGGS